MFILLPELSSPQLLSIETDPSHTSRQAEGISSLLRANTGEVICVVVRIVARIGSVDSAVKGEARPNMLAECGVADCPFSEYQGAC